MSPRRREITDVEWSIIAPLLPNKSRGVPRADDRKVLNGIFRRLRTCLPWTDIPDAPTADLDRAAEIQLLFTIRDLTADGITCILATDAVDFVRRATDTVHMMEAGRIVRHGMPEMVFANPLPARMAKLAA